MGRKINTDAVGGFAIDSFPGDKKKKKKLKFLRAIYPENKNEGLPKRAMIDLDGTIHRYSQGYKDGKIYDDAFTGAKEVINWLKKQGFEIVIFTTRASVEANKEFDNDRKEEIKNIIRWLRKHDIYFDRITGEKLAASFYIDDRAIYINNGDWDAVFNVIKKRIKYL